MKHVHFIGIGGSGLSAIARILLERGNAVSGSDRVESAMTRQLAGEGIKVFLGHDAKNVHGADLVVRSSAVRDDNPEVQAALTAGIPVLKRSEFMQELMAGQDCIAIAGTHGKTTTTAMTAWALTSLKLDPSYIIGGISKNLGANAHAGQGRYFIIEADEYDHMFLGLSPAWAIVTIVEHDHPDCFPTPEEYRSEFRLFINKLQSGGTLLACQDDPGAAALLDAIPAGSQAISYGLSEAANYQARNLIPGDHGNQRFDLWQAQTRLAEVSLAVPGIHNVRNACAVLALAHQMGLPLAQTALALAAFTGSGRRFDVRGQVKGVTVIDDYAHHPTEIRATLSAARQAYPGQRIWAVWQPHTFSRTRALLDEFARAFSDADRVIVTEVFAAREQNPGFSSRQVVDAMLHPAAEFIAGLDAAAKSLLDRIQTGDVILVLSAGDADHISERVFSELQKWEALNG